MQIKEATGGTENKRISKVLLTFYILILILLSYTIFIIDIPLSTTLKYYIISLIWTVLFCKIVILDKYLFDMKGIYYSTKIFDIILFIGIDKLSSLNHLTYTAFFMTLILLAFVYAETEAIKFVTAASIVTYIELVILHKFFFGIDIEIANYINLLLIVFNLLVLFMTGFLVTKITAQMSETISKREKFVNETLTKNEELVKENTEIKYKANELEFKINHANKSLAELTTIQEVSKVINSTLDVKELFAVVNDVIIGVLGVIYCTIFLKEDNEQKISIQSSNIPDESYLNAIKEKVGLKIIDLMEKGHRTFGNAVDPLEYPYAIERNIQSVMYVPIINKNKVLGLIVAEHTIDNGLTEDTKKFIEILANQVGVAVENAILYEKMEKIVSQDPDTKAYNRNFFINNLRDELEQKKYTLSLVLIELDKYSTIIKTYGQEFVIRILRSIVQLLNKNVASDGIVARYDEDKLAILYKNINLETAFKKAEELHEIIGKAIIKYNDKAISVTVSVGVSEYPKLANDFESFIKTTEEALARAKEDGGNCAKKGLPRIQKGEI